MAIQTEVMVVALHRNVGRTKARAGINCHWNIMTVQNMQVIAVTRVGIMFMHAFIHINLNP